MRRLIKIYVVLSVILFGVIIFYVRFPKIWGSAVYPLEYEGEIIKYSKEFQISPSFVASVIYSESHFHQDAISSAGAVGLMQIMPTTGARLAKTLGDKDFTVDKLRDPDRNIRYGTYYLKELIDRHQGDMDKALMAYNGGEGAVISYESRGTLPRETEGYVRKVKGTWEMYQQIYDSKWAEIEVQELEKQRASQEKREIKRKISERIAKGETLSSDTKIGWEFTIFWPFFWE
ncbi:MAG: lytic transglycosylase domain-containing protein [Candidatus Berkelbacteria bacterium]|nr:lytic transglycosylase domain-containing protein [Candidatus Berkelbacteria bacterium]